MLIVTPSAPFLRPLFAPHHTASSLDEREGTSELELASRTLSHAVNYLVNEQLAGHRSSLAANREAIAILCDAGRGLALVERREPARRAIASWLHGSSLVRALWPSTETFS